MYKQIIYKKNEKQQPKYKPKITIYVSYVVKKSKK
jgi:hypothetical protein